MSADAPEFVPPRASSPAARRYWAATYFVRRVVFLALIVWCAVNCILQLPGPRWEAALAGLVCAGIVLWVQGGWVWRRYRRWVT